MKTKKKRAILSGCLSEHDSDLLFLSDKGMDVATKEGLEKARVWVWTTSPDNLLYGDPEGNPVDIMVGAARRERLMGTIALELRKYNEND